MKTLRKILTLTALLLAGSFSAFAQTTLLISIPILAGNSTLNTDLTISLDLSDGVSWLYIEENQNLEDWMLSREDWIKEPMADALHAAIDTEKEAELVLEDWMLVDLSQEIQNTWEFLKADIEAPLKLEDWMICEESWCKKISVSGSVSSL